MKADRDDMIRIEGTPHLQECALSSDVLTSCTCGSVSPPLARPFAKSAGGKTKLIPDLDTFFPRRIRTYVEPFVGGGALFWHLANERRLGHAILSDTNPELYFAYLAVRDHVDDLVRALRSHTPDEEHFCQVRVQDTEKLTTIERAARFLYLNKTAFNGLWRVNKAGRFNVPWAGYKNPTICDESNLRACSRVLQGVEILLRPFEEVLTDGLGEGDVVYFDPPYLPISKTSNFTGYTSEGFKLEDHERLRDVVWDLKQRGVRVVVSNSAAEPIRDLYKEGFAIHPVQAARAVNSKGTGRGKIEEWIIT